MSTPETDALPRVPPRWSLLFLAAALLVGTIARVSLNDLEQFSPADETVYTNIAAYLHQYGVGAYGTVVQSYISDSSRWIYPNPLRWGYLLLCDAACTVTGSCDGHTLAWLSTLAGIASLFLTYLIGRELLGELVGVIAAVLSISSPLQLALGRRALQDELYCALFLLVAWLVLRIARLAPGERSAGLYASAIAAVTLGLATKELMLFLLPVLALYLLWQRGWRPRRLDVLLFVLPPLLYIAGFAALSGSFSDFFTVGRIIAGISADAYPVQYQAGPLHRLVIDYLAISPLVLLLAVAAFAELRTAEGEEKRGAWTIALGALYVVLLFSLFASKNVRYVVPADPLLRILAAWAIVRFSGPARRFAFLALPVIASLAAEAALFYVIFIREAVYDPVTAELFRALRMLPR